MNCIQTLIAFALVFRIILISDYAQASCQAPAPVCAAALNVFPVRAYSPSASGVRIGANLIITNRHVVTNERSAKVQTKIGEHVVAEVIPSSYPGDLILLRVKGLGTGPRLETAPPPNQNTMVYAIGFDQGRQAIRVYRSGRLLSPPDKNKALSRLHHNAISYPGNSGGALVDKQGRLLGIITSGGEGRHDAIPISQIESLKSMSGPDHKSEHSRISLAYRQCIAATDSMLRSRQILSNEQVKFLDERCRTSNNRQLIDLAAQALGKHRRFDESLALFKVALGQDPNSLNTQLGIVVTLHLARQYSTEVPYLYKLIQTLPRDIQVLRFAIQAGTWGGAPDLADQAMLLLKRHHPKLVPLAERFRRTPAPTQGR